MADVQKHSAGLIGDGRVATSLGLAWQHAGVSFQAFYNRKNRIPEGFSGKGSRILTTPQDFPADLDVIFVAVSDDAVEEIMDQLPAGPLAIQFSGGLKNPTRGAVLWPVQSIQPDDPASVKNTPIVVTADRKEMASEAQRWAQMVSDEVQLLSEKERQLAHLAAVFSANFTNHAFALGQSLCAQAGLDWSLLRPLVEATAQRALEGTSHRAQTGPALRRDFRVIQAHLDSLENEPELQKIYAALTQSIQQFHP